MPNYLFTSGLKDAITPKTPDQRFTTLADKFPTGRRSQELEDQRRKAAALNTRLNSLSARFTANLTAGETPGEPYSVTEARKCIATWEAAQLTRHNNLVLIVAAAINMGDFALVDKGFQDIIQAGGLNE